MSLRSSAHDARLARCVAHGSARATHVIDDVRPHCVAGSFVSAHRRLSEVLPELILSNLAYFQQNRVAMSAVEISTMPAAIVAITRARAMSRAAGRSPSPST